MPIEKQNKNMFTIYKRIRDIRNHNEILGKDTKTLILCFKGGKNLGSILVKATLQQTTNNDKT